MGINVGDIIIEDDDIFGDGVNIAARLEACGICISSAAHEQVRDKVDFWFEDMGEQQLKNIARPMRTHRIVIGATSDPLAAPAADAMPLSLPAKPSIAVLPFQNMSGDAEQEFFADGIAEDVITLLSKSRGLFVIARNSTFTYKGQAADIKRVGQTLGVRYVLQGSVRRAGNRVRVTAQLIEATTGGHLWAERYDRDLLDIFAVQDEITASVSAAILPTVERSERDRVAHKPPTSLDAWETYHRGMWHVFKVNHSDNRLARTLFERCLQIDPGLGTAWGGLALTNIMNAWLYRPTENRATAVSTASDCAHKCLAIDPTDAVGRFVLATALTMLGRHAEATAEAELCVAHNPNHAWGFAVLGGIRAFGGRPAEAFEPLETALRLSPFDPLEYFWRHWISRAHYWCGNYEAAAVVARRVWRSHPQVHVAARTLIAALGQLGRRDEAHKVMYELIDQFGETHFRENLVLQTSETRDEDYRNLLDGYRKAGVLD